MMRMRWLMRFGVGLAGLIAGAIWSGCRVPLYGAVAAYGIATPPHDPKVKLEELRYTPAGQVPQGTTVRFEAQLNKPTTVGAVNVTVGSPLVASIALTDSGYSPDLVANDGVWTGEWEVPADQPPGTLPVTATLWWFDGYTVQEVTGPPLDIREGEQQ